MPTIAGIAALFTVSALVVATLSGHGGSRAGLGDPRAQLESLADRWLRTPATITYRTSSRAPGVSPSHQCLRQMAGGAIDPQTAVRMCSREGEMRLTWDPPSRWRMDVVSPTETFTVLSTPKTSSLCRPTAAGASRCVGGSPEAAESDTPFRSVVVPPDRIIEEFGAAGPGALTRGRDRTIAGIRAHCFWATGTSGEAEWCYSAAGLLLSVLTRIGDGPPTTAEAASVSADVDETDLEVGASRSPSPSSRSELSAIVGTWTFDALTGVPPSQLPPGAVRDNRHDLVVRDDGSFRWGRWSGSIKWVDPNFLMYVELPEKLSRRFDRWAAFVVLSLDGHRLNVSLPDLGRDRDEDFGSAVEDIDSPDMRLRMIGG